MSGGSFNYLCNAWDIDDLLNKRGELMPMAERLASLGHHDAAKETFATLHALNAAAANIEAHVDRLREVWKAVEWHASADWGPESIDAAVAEYRGITEATS